MREIVYFLDFRKDHPIIVIVIVILYLCKEKLTVKKNRASRRGDFRYTKRFSLKETNLKDKSESFILKEKL